MAFDGPDGPVRAPGAFRYLFMEGDDDLEFKRISSVNLGQFQGDKKEVWSFVETAKQ